MSTSSARPRMRVFLAFRLCTALSSLVWGGGACRGSRSLVVAPRGVGQPVGDLHVAAQAEFSVSLVDPIEKHASFARRKFQARVEYPVRSPENEIVIQTNALVRGEVVGIDTAPVLVVKFKFHEIETVWGPTRLEATVRSAEPFALVSSASSHDGPRFDAALHPLFVTPVGAEAGSERVGSAVGDGPRSAAERTEIILPRGARMRLLLTEPVVPPRTKDAWQ